MISFKTGNSIDEIDDIKPVVVITLPRKISVLDAAQIKVDRC